jgi:hypothetical protein
MFKYWIFSVIFLFFTFKSKAQSKLTTDESKY